MHTKTETVSKTEVINAIFDNADIGFLLFDRHELYYRNRYAEDLLGIPFGAGKHSSDILPSALFRLLDERLGSEFNEGFFEANSVEEVELRFTSGDSRWIEAAIATLEIDGNVFQQLTLRDISKSKRRESELEKQANTDDLSGLSNRRQFRHVLDCYADAPISIAMIDVDHFKNVNDSFGHALGDSALRFLGSELLAHFGQSLCVARLGGEEFAVVTKFTDKQQVELAFEEFRESIAQRKFSESEIRLTVSIGLAFTEADEGVGELLSRADTALYVAKNAGRNRLSVFGR